MEKCEYEDDCRNKDNYKKCSRCEHNQDNFEAVEKEGYSGEVHDRHNKKFYVYADNYDPL